MLPPVSTLSTHEYHNYAQETKTQCNTFTGHVSLVVGRLLKLGDVMLCTCAANSACHGQKDIITENCHERVTGMFIVFSFMLHWFVHLLRRFCERAAQSRPQHTACFHIMSVPRMTPII